MDIRVLSYEDTTELLTTPDCVTAIKAAFEEEAKGLTVNRPRSHTKLKLEGGSREDWVSYELKTMDGIIKARGYAALRIASMQFHHYFVNGLPRDEYLASIPSPQGEKRYFELVMLFEVASARLVAVMPGGHIQAMRVGCSTAVGNSHMARKNSKSFGIIGSGWQAMSQLLAHKELFSIESVKVFSITPAHRERFASEMTRRLGVTVEPVSSAEEAVRGSDILLCATSSHDPNRPVFKGEWLERGIHWSIITREAGMDAFDRSDHVAVLSHVVAQNVWMPGDDHGPLARGRQPVDVEKFPTLADLIADPAKGREHDDDITGFVTTEGMGIQFVALASLIYERSIERNLGHVENWDHLLQSVHP